jgi:peptidoglycan/LPS O-acetylase OafA/YrhL
MEKILPDSSLPRFVFIDALRGIAAFAVLFHHLMHNSIMGVPLQRIVPAFITEINRYSALGVQIFFVLSGFVIAHSLRDNPLTGRSIGNFILRRQLRLDPTYWLIIVLALCLHRVELAMPGLVTDPMPSFQEILLNFFYLQNIFGVDQIVMVAWTLCIEVQFYIAFIMSLAAGKFIERTFNNIPAGLASTALVFLTGVISLVLVQWKSYPAWFIHYWFYFAAGVLCYWAINQPNMRTVFLCFTTVFGINMLIAFLRRSSSGETLAPAMLVGVLTAMTIYWVGRKGQLTEMWNHRTVQYFGRISYSLYLVHHIVIIIVLRGAYKLTGENEVMSIIWALVAGALSVGAAHLLFNMVERPSMRFASQLSPRNSSLTNTNRTQPIETDSGFATEKSG